MAQLQAMFNVVPKEQDTNNWMKTSKEKRYLSAAANDDSTNGIFKQMMPVTCVASSSWSIFSPDYAWCEMGPIIPQITQP